MNAPDVDRPPIDFALYLASVGLRILPIPPRSKRPVLKDWPTVATCDPDMICAWFDADPEYKPIETLNVDQSTITVERGVAVAAAGTAGEER